MRMYLLTQREDVMKYLLPVAIVIILAALFTLVVASAIAYRAGEVPEFRVYYVGGVEVFEPPPIHSGVVALATPMKCGGFSLTDKLQTHTADLVDGAISYRAISHVRLRMI